jgi:hypothetical protein
MRQPIIFLLLLLVGGVFGGTVVIVSRFHEQPSKIWTTTRELTTDNGIIQMRRPNCVSCALCRKGLSPLSCS